MSSTVRNDLRAGLEVRLAVIGRADNSQCRVSRTHSLFNSRITTMRARGAVFGYRAMYGAFENPRKKTAPRTAEWCGASSTSWIARTMSRLQCRARTRAAHQGKSDFKPRPPDCSFHSFWPYAAPLMIAWGWLAHDCRPAQDTRRAARNRQPRTRARQAWRRQKSCGLDGGPFSLSRPQSSRGQPTKVPQRTWGGKKKNKKKNKPEKKFAVHSFSKVRTSSENDSNDSAWSASCQAANAGHTREHHQLRRGASCVPMRSTIRCANVTDAMASRPWRPAGPWAANSLAPTLPTTKYINEARPRDLSAADLNCLSAGPKIVAFLAPAAPPFTGGSAFAAIEATALRWCPRHRMNCRTGH